MKVKIISDSTCDLSPELLSALDISLTPLTVSLEQRSGKDGVDIHPEDIYDYVRSSGDLPKTSAVSIGEYMEQFQTYRAQGYEIVQYCIGDLFSTCYQNACVAAKECGGVYVVNSRNLCTGQGLLVMHGAELAQQGKSAAEIAEACTRLVPQVEASFVIDSIDHLYKGGRCSALAAFGANLLHLKPCIELRDGRMEPGRKYRGKMEHVIPNYIADRLRDRQDIDLHRVFLTHTNCTPDMISQARELIQSYLPGVQQICETTAGATITTHCGEHTLGVFFLRR